MNRVFIDINIIIVIVGRFAKINNDIAWVLEKSFLVFGGAVFWSGISICLLVCLS